MKKFESFNSTFSTIRTEGGLLPADILGKILAGDTAMPGASADAYHLPKGEKLNEAINRSWTRVRALWEKFRQQRETLETTDTGTTQTRETLLLPLFAELGYGRLFGAKAEERVVGNKVFSISHFWHHSPIHLIGCKVDLDKKSSGVRGAAQSSPHSTVQDFLNRSDAHLWGFCSNGLCLRILRDNQSLSRQAFVEFDLESMFEGEVFSDFALLWLLCHQSRVESESPSSCWLEQWAKSAQDQGVRALETLRGSVQKTIEILGQGFLESYNPDFKERLRSGALSRQDYFRQLLRLVYRLLFLFTAEDRGLLHAASTPEKVKKRYAAWHSSSRLRRLAGKLPGTRHHDLYEGLKLLMAYLGSDGGCPALGLSPLGSFLWAADTSPDVHSARLSNGHLLHAVRALAYTETEGIRRPIDYKNVGARELGSIYESLLELHPVLDTSSGAFRLETASGNERKTTGSYYTPTPLIESLLDSALEPVIKQAIARENPEVALLELKICDPACGSGHFLIAGSHRLAKRLAAVRTGDEEPGPDAVRKALRDVIGRCIYGVDVNPMAVELCKVSLWLEALEPGKPLSFLDHHIRCGNSLIGAVPELITDGLPDEAFKPIAGDEAAACTALKRINRTARQIAQMPLLAQQAKEIQARLREAAVALEAIPSDSLQDILTKENAFRQHESTPEYQGKCDIANAWCAAFVMSKYFPEKPGYPGVLEDAPMGITQRELNALASGHPLRPEVHQEVEYIADQYQFFHWHLAYPEVFAKGGFDVMLGNPPWEHTELKEKEWFAERHPEIANARTGAERKRMIAALEKTDPELFVSFCGALRLREGGSHFLSNSGRYPFCGRGRINTYAVFGESMRSLINDTGRVGCILPSGIATDDTTKFFFQDMVDKKSLVSLFDFQNKGIFPAVDSRVKFCLLTSGQGTKPTTEQAEFVFFAHSVDELSDPEKRFPLSSRDIELVNPNTRTCPIFRSRHDAELTKAIYRRVPVLIKEVRDGRPEENTWGIKFKQGLFNMTSDSHLFRTREQLEAEGWELDGNVFNRLEYLTREDGTPDAELHKYLPLYEAKMIHHFNHRWATYEGTEIRETSLEEKQDSQFSVLPRYWVRENDVHKKLDDINWKHGWLLGWRDICRSTDERTTISSFWPYSAAGDTFLQMFTEHYKYAHCLLGCLNSFSLDYVTRQKIGGVHLKYHYFKQLPVLPLQLYLENFCYFIEDLPSWIRTRICELSYVSWDLTSLAQDCDYSGPPFSWDEERRFLLRSELDAAFFHLYLPTDQDGTWKKAEGETNVEFHALCEAFPTPRHAVDYIMDSFNIVKGKDESAYGKYRTKQTILQVYDAMQEAIRTGKAYESALLPVAEPAPEPVAVPAPPVRPYVYQPTAADFPYYARERRITACVPALIRDCPGKGFLDYCDAMLLATNPEVCKSILPPHRHFGFDQALAATGLGGWSFPATDKVRYEKLRIHLKNNGINIGPGNGVCRLPDSFNFNNVPKLTSLASYLFEAQQLINDASITQRSDSVVIAIQEVRAQVEDRVYAA